VRQDNLFGKASRSRVEDILSVFKQRYLKDPELLGALVKLAKGRIPAESLDRILYFQATRSDPLLHDLVTEVLANWSARSDREVRVWEVHNWVDEQVAAGKTERPRSPEVQRRTYRSRAWTGTTSAVSRSGPAASLCTSAANKLWISTYA
jgi:bacteriophage exclusion system BrxA-like protein